MSAVDVPALLLSILVAAGITAVVAFFADSGTRRDWIVAGALALGLIALAIVNLLGETPRETHIATALVGPLLPVAGAVGMARATRGVRRWIRWLVVFLLSFVLLLSGLLLGASILPRFLGS